MKTPQRFISSLKRRIVTLEVLSEVLYSVNKRAKNAMLMKEDYYWRAMNIPYEQRWKYHHAVQYYKDRQKHFYENKDYLISTFLYPVAIHEIKSKKDYYMKYLYFKINGRSFHQPINDYWHDKEIIKTLPVNRLDGFKVFGVDSVELISSQFCSKFIEMIQSGKYLSMFPLPHSE